MFVVGLKSYYIVDLHDRKKMIPVLRSMILLLRNTYLNPFRLVICAGVSSLPTETEALCDVAVDDVMRTAIRCLKNTLQHVHAQTPEWGGMSGAVTSLIGGLRVFYVRGQYTMDALKEGTRVVFVSSDDSTNIAQNKWSFFRAIVTAM